MSASWHFESLCSVQQALLVQKGLGPSLGLLERGLEKMAPGLEMMTPLGLEKMTHPGLVKMAPPGLVKMAPPGLVKMAPSGLVKMTSGLGLKGDLV